MPDHAATVPSARSIITTIAPTDLGDLPPDALADATFEARYGVGDLLDCLFDVVDFCAAFLRPDPFHTCTAANFPCLRQTYIYRLHGAGCVLLPCPAFTHTSPHATHTLLASFSVGADG